MTDKQQPESSATSKNRNQRFVETVIDRCQKDKVMAARLRRSDNPATEYQCWELLGHFGVDLEKDYERLPHVTVAANIAKAKAEKNGTLSLGKAILKCYDNDRDSDQAKARLRRLLACNDLPEVCRMLRPILTLINSRVSLPIDYVRLLSQLRFFEWDAGQRTKTQWAQEFYAQVSEPENQEGAA